MSERKPVLHDGFATAAELAVLRAQRDALAMVVLGVWQVALDGYASGPGDVDKLMTTAGLAEEDLSVEVIGDPMLRLSAFGRAALAGAKPP